MCWRIWMGGWRDGRVLRLSEADRRLRGLKPANCSAKYRGSSPFDFAQAQNDERSCGCEGSVTLVDVEADALG
jgi:hypothetical protein